MSLPSLKKYQKCAEVNPNVQVDNKCNSNQFDLLLSKLVKHPDIIITLQLTMI